MNSGFNATAKSGIMIDPINAIALYCLTGLVIYGLALLHQHRNNLHSVKKEESPFAESLSSNASVPERIAHQLVQLIAGSLCLLVWPIIMGVLVWHKLRMTLVVASVDDDSIHHCRTEYLVAKTSLAIAEISGQIEDPTNLTPHLPFGHLFSAWVDFCSRADFDSEVWCFRIPKGSCYGPHSQLAQADILGYAVVKNDVIIAEFIAEFH